MSKISIFIFLTSLIKTQKCEVDSFSAVAAMEKLLSTQAHLIESVKYSLQFVDKNEKGIVKTYLAKLKKEHALSRKDPEHYLGNPINSYALIMRLFRDLQFVERILNKTNTYKRNTSLVYPSRTDVDGANAGLFLMQIMYGLDIQELADGKIVGRFSKNKQQFEEFVSPLTANDCFDLADLYFIEEDRTVHATWLEEAYKKYDKDHALCHFTEDALLKMISQSYGFMEDWRNTVYWLEKYLAVNKNDSQAQGIYELVKDLYEENQYNTPVFAVIDGVYGTVHKNKKYEKGYIIKKIFQSIDARDMDGLMQKPRISLEKKLEMDPKVMSLCRYESGPIARKMNLSCYYAHGPHRFLQLAPIKAEILHRDPDVTMFYDIISDAEIEVFKTHAKPQLTRSKVLEDNIKKASLSWTSQTMKPSYELTAVSRVLQRIRQFTGLRWRRSTHDRMIVGNYGLAGYYTPHCDFFASKKSKETDPKKQKAAGHKSQTVTEEKKQKMNKKKYCRQLKFEELANKWIQQMDQDLSRPCPVHPPQPKCVLKNACS